MFWDRFNYETLINCYPVIVSCVSMVVNTSTVFFSVIEYAAESESLAIWCMIIVLLFSFINGRKAYIGIQTFIRNLMFQEAPGEARPKAKRSKLEAIVGPAVNEDIAHEAVGLKRAALLPKEMPLVKKNNPVLQVSAFLLGDLCLKNFSLVDVLSFIGLDVCRLKLHQNIFRMNRWVMQLGRNY